VNELYNHSKVKAMVSFTKGEGFGRPLLEFGLTGKPIIASGWSGHIDFLHPEYNVLLSGNLEKVHPSAANNWLIQESQWFQVNSKQGISALKEVIRVINNIYKDLENKDIMLKLILVGKK